MKRHTHSMGFAALVQLFIVGAVIASAFMLPGCATLGAVAPTTEQLAVAACKHWFEKNPQAAAEMTNQGAADICDNAGGLFLDIVALMDAKSSPKAVMDALVAHPPLSAAAAAAVSLPCIEVKPPVEEPQSRLEKLNRRLYPPVMIVEGPDGE